MLYFFVVHSNTVVSNSEVSHPRLYRTHSSVPETNYLKTAVSNPLLSVTQYTVQRGKNNIHNVVRCSFCCMMARSNGNMVDVSNYYSGPHEF